jgi:hypothetical protein
MEQNVFVLLLGIVLGAAAASGIWAVLWALIKGDSRLQKDRVAIMQEIAALCVEMDSLICGDSSRSVAAHAALLEKLNRKFAVSMPLLEVYYVKYIESLIARYKQTSFGDQPMGKIVGAHAPAQPAPLEKKAGAPQAAVFVKPEAPKQSTKEPAKELRPAPAVVIVKKPEPEITSEKTAEFLVTAEAKPDQNKTQMIYEKSDADLTEAITTQMQLKPGEELRNKKAGSFRDKAPAKEISREETGEVNIEDLIVTQKIDLKNESAAPAKPAAPEEHFISGEDVIDKLDSFFGFENK